MSVLPALLILATAALPAARAQPGTATDTQPVTWDAALRLRHEHGESPETVALTGTYHNLLRMWADT